MTQGDDLKPGKIPPREGPASGTLQYAHPARARTMAIHVISGCAVLLLGAVLVLRARSTTVEDTLNFNIGSRRYPSLQSLPGSIKAELFSNTTLPSEQCSWIVTPAQPPWPRKTILGFGAFAGSGWDQTGRLVYFGFILVPHWALLAVAGFGAACGAIRVLFCWRSRLAN